MSDIDSRFRSLRGRGEGALITYITCGDPEPDLTINIAEALVAGGADIIELGLPFSDPIADGPVIQAATMRALKKGITPMKVLKTAKDVKEKLGVPTVILTYFNPVYQLGLKRFCELASKNGVDGIVIPDLPVEEAGEYRRIAKGEGIDTIFLAAPSTPPNRIDKIIQHTSGFLYLVSTFGVTGVRERLEDSTVKLIKRFLHHVKGQIPLAVGFGISKPQHVRAVIQGGADGAIAGSVFVKIIQENHFEVDNMLRKLEKTASHLKAATKN
jgi:tryptophan synthase alpha chain